MTDASNAAPGEPGDKELWYVLEERQAFSRSLLWDIQRNYYSRRGADAWRSGEVPHYVTSNPTMAQACAETVFAFYQDRQRLQTPPVPSQTDALAICELGAGSGRFAFHFLRHLLALCADHAVPPSAFLYVLTDFTQTNLDAWRGHARFQDWFASGLLDVALFDVNQSDALHLQISGAVISRGALHQPLVVLANYVFDGVPQDLLYFKDGVAHHALVSLATPEKPDQLDATALLSQLHIDCEYQVCGPQFYAEPALQAELEHYGRCIVAPGGAHVLFPASGLRCLARLQALSQAGMLLLSADKGDCQLAEVVYATAPGLVVHGSFSFNVNYHAFAGWCEALGGLALLPQKSHESIAVIGLLLLENAEEHAGTRRAYRQHIGGFGPDGFYTVSRCLSRQATAMNAGEIFATMRFNRNDAYQLAQLIPRIVELVPALSKAQVVELKQLLHDCWQAYFPMGEESDLAFDIGGLFYALDDFPAALQFFEYTRNIYGSHTGTLFNMAACHDQMGQYELARPLLERLLQVAPANEAARALLSQLSA